MPWELTGNAGTVDANFLGTTDARPLRIKTGATTPARGDVVHITSGTPGELGRVGIRTITPQRALHVEQTEIHTGGIVGGYSFGNREAAAFVEFPGSGERWVWYATGGTARLWSGTDKLLVTPGGNLLVGNRLGIGNVATAPSQSLELSRGNMLLPNAMLGTDGNLYFGGITNARAPGMRLFGGVVNRGTAAEGAGGFLDVRTRLADEGLVIRVDTAEAATERLVISSTQVRHFIPLFDASSDIRTKTNIRRLGGMLDKLEHIRGVSFVWDESSLGGVPGQPSIGVVAQEVEEVFPELVSTSGDQGYKAVDYSGLTAALIEAAKELKADNEALRSRIEALERA